MQKKLQLQKVVEEEPLSSGYKVQTYWDLLDEEFKPKGNKLLSIIELWTRSKQGDKPLNQWLTQVYNLVNICKYPEDSTDRIIRDVLIVGCNSNHARDKIIRQGEAVTLNEVIEILQTEESTHSTMQQSVYYFLELNRLHSECRFPLVSTSSFYSLQVIIFPYPLPHWSKSFSPYLCLIIMGE